METNTNIRTLEQIARQVREDGFLPQTASEGRIFQAIEGCRRDDRINPDISYDAIETMITDFQTYYQEDF